MKYEEKVVINHDLKSRAVVFIHMIRNEIYDQKHLCFTTTVIHADTDNFFSKFHILDVLKYQF